MKKALNLLLAYFLFLLTGIFLLTLFNVLHLSVQNFIAGSPSTFFNEERVISSFFYASFMTLFVICPSIAYYRIRHAGGVLQFVAYVLICLITWALLFPSLHILEKKYSQKHHFESSLQNLSSGYFRKSGERIYYFKNDFSEISEDRYETNALVIDLSDDGKISSRSIVNSPYFELNREASPYSDILIKQNFETSSKYPFSFSNLISQGRNSFDKGFSFYLGFLSIALVICCLYAMTGFFEWKLLNSCFLIVATTICFLLNGFYFSNLFNPLRTFFSSKKIIIFLSSYFDYPVLLIENIFFSLLFIIFGLIRMIVKKHKAKA